jgi:putative ABC transport system substrate-binding protein
VVAGGLLASPRRAAAQKSSDKPVRLGILGIGAAPTPEELARSVAANRFWVSMKQRGWVDGQNIVVERRFGESVEQLRAAAAELVGLRVDVLFAGSAGLAKMLQSHTRTIPIVVGRAEGDLVEAGLVESLAKPGRNITGSQLINDELVPKRLEFLKALVPTLSSVVVLREGLTIAELPQIAARYDRQVVASARALGADVRTVVVRGASDLAAAFAEMAGKPGHGVLVTSSPFMFVYRQSIVRPAMAQRIPVVYETQVFVEAGGLMSYGVDVTEMEQRAATYVDRILRGARPADLPIEQPTKFDLVINATTAKAMGVIIPPGLLARADRIIS